MIPILKLADNLLACLQRRRVPAIIRRSGGCEKTEIGSAPFRLRTFTVVACLSAGAAICRVRAIEMPLRVIVASGRRTATALTRQVKALDAVTISSTRSPMRATAKTSALLENSTPVGDAMFD